MRWVVAWVMIAVVLIAGIGLPARADECKLRAIPFDLVPNVFGQVLVPLKVNGKPALFQLDTGAFWSVMYRSKTIGMPVDSGTRARIQGLGGQISDQFVTLPSLSIGPVELRDTHMFVEPDILGQDDRIYGLIGANILTRFDIELNLAENKLNFFVPSGCGDRAVYWKNDGFSELDFLKNSSNQIVVTMKLDGKKVKTVVDTGATTSLLTMNSASDLFDLEPGAPGVEESGETFEMHGDKLPLYRHRFDSLEMEGLRFKNVWITMSDGKIGSGGLHSVNNYDLLLGIHEIRNIHLYISYHDKKLYFTKASVRPSDDLAQGTAATASLPAVTMDALDWQLLQPGLQRSESASRDGKFDDALAPLNDLIAHYPNFAILYYNKALVDQKRRDGEAAIADLDRAIELFPSYADAYRLRSDLRRSKHDEDGAKADLDAAAKYEPNSAEAYQIRAEQRERIRDLDGALADLGYAVDLDPKRAATYGARGGLFLYLKDYEHALADYRRVVELEPQNVIAIESIGRTLHQMGRQEEALAEFAHAVELAGDAAHSHNNYCWQLALMEQFESALAECNRSVELAPKSPYVMDTRGYVYLKLHRLTEAVTDFDTALEINPKLPHTLYARSVAKQEMGDTREAKANLAAAIKLQPDIAQHFPE